MKLHTQLYIDVGQDPLSDTPDYQLVDFFDFESIEITSAIKTIQEVDKVFTDYTKDFVVPASTNNNKIFQHYYYTKLTGGFDARIKRRARIFINGVFFKQGYIRLQSSQIKDGYPYSYSLNFFGALSGLEDVIGEDELSSLDYLKRYDHSYSADDVLSGLTSGLQYRSGSMEVYGGINPTISRDIVYPLISAYDSFFYDSDGVSDKPEVFRQGVSENLYNNNVVTPDGNKGLTYTNLKPAIKVSNIIDAITEKYTSINFAPDSFVYENQFKDLYLLLHNNKGILDTVKGDFETQSARFDVNDVSDFTRATGNDVRPLLTYSRIEKSYFIVSDQLARRRQKLDLTVTVNSPASDIQYYVELYDDTRVLRSWSPQATTTLSYTLETKDEKYWNNLHYVVKSDGGLTDFDLSLSITSYYETTNALSNLVEWTKDYQSTNITWSSNSETATYTSVSGYNFLTEIEILKHIPKMKVIDFLKGIFQMFNLVADVDADTGQINVITLNDYYNAGTDRDITDYIDTYNYDVDRVQLYGKMDFKYEEPKTFGIINHNEQLNDDFGNLAYPDEDDSGSFNIMFDKGKYEVKLPFEKLYYERLSNEATITRPLEQDKRTDICWGWLVDKDQNTTLTKPILFYNTNQSVNTTKYKFGVKGVTTPVFISTYNRAGNSNFDESYSLNFDEERDEFSYSVVENSLFNLYYRGYITNIFNQLARNIKVEARLPLSFLFEYKLNDRLLIDGVPFRINEITTNINTGKSQLDIITDYGIVVPEDTTAPSQVTGVTELSSSSSGFEISWNEATDDVAVTNYNIYVGGVLNKTVGSVLTTRITGLSPSTLYNIQVSALDKAGNEGTLSTGVNMTTDASPTDVTAPSVPLNLRTTLIGTTAIGIEWDASTDDVGVDVYRVYVDGVFNQNVSHPTTTANISGLVTGTEYTITVSARDAAFNESAKSTPLIVSTI